MYYYDGSSRLDTNIRQPMLKLKTHSGFHDLFLTYLVHTPCFWNIIFMRSAQGQKIGKRILVSNLEPETSDKIY
jgi:hypothetical protein